jgi:hypothetical protein
MATIQVAKPLPDNEALAVLLAVFAAEVSWVSADLPVLAGDSSSPHAGGPDTEILSEASEVAQATPAVVDGNTARRAGSLGIAAFPLAVAILVRLLISGKISLRDVTWTRPNPVKSGLSCATPPTWPSLFGALAARDHALVKIGVISPLR